MQLMIQLPGLQMLGLECKSLHFGVLREMFFFWFFFFRYTTSNWPIALLKDRKREERLGYCTKTGLKVSDNWFCGLLKGNGNFWFNNFWSLKQRGECLQPSVNHSGGSAMVWDDISGSGVEELANWLNYELRNKLSHFNPPYKTEKEQKNVANGCQHPKKSFERPLENWILLIGIIKKLA